MLLIAGASWLLLKQWADKSDITIGVDRTVTYNSKDDIAQAMESYGKAGYAKIITGSKNRVKTVKDGSKKESTVRSADRGLSENRVAIVFDRLSETSVNEKILKVLNDHKARATFSVPGVEAAENDEFIASLPVKDTDIAGNTLEDSDDDTKDSTGRLIEKLIMTKNVLGGLADKEISSVFLSGTRYSANVCRAVKACGFDYVIEPDNDDLIDSRTFKDRDEVAAYVSKLSGDTIIMIELNGLADAIKEEIPVYPDVPAVDKKPDAESDREEAEEEEEEEPVEIDVILDWLLSELEERDIKTELVKNFEAVEFEDLRLSGAGENENTAPVYKSAITDKSRVGFAIYGLPAGNPDEVLSALKEARAGATFFISGVEAIDHGDLVNKIRQEGYDIACAGFTGEDMTGRQADECYEEIEKGLGSVSDLNNNASACYMPGVEIKDKAEVTAKDLFGEDLYGIRNGAAANGVKLIYPVSVKNPEKGDIHTVAAENGVVDINKMKEFFETAKKERLKVVSVDNLIGSSGQVTAYTANDIRSLRSANGGEKKEPAKYVQTAQNAVALEFYGLPSLKELESLLNGLSKRGARGTFYVTYQDMTQKPFYIEKIVLAGQELGIAYRETKVYPQDFEVVLRYLNSCRQYMKWRFNTETDVVMMPTGEAKEDTMEAVSAAGFKLAGFTFNFAGSRLSSMSAADAESEAAVFDNVRVHLGSALLFRPDVYEDIKNGILPAVSGNGIVSENEASAENEAFTEDEGETPSGKGTEDKEGADGENGAIAAFVEEILKRQVDSIAYTKEGEDKPEKDSEYKILGMQELMEGDEIYELPENKQDDIRLDNDVISGMETDEERVAYITEHYTGNPSVLTKGEFPGFTGTEIKKFDKKGTISEDQVIFLTFDDWGSDRSINKLLYVLKKHDVKATFFVKVQGTEDNPNLLRKIAYDGHEIASHTYSHYKLAETGNGVHFTELTASDNRTLRRDIVKSYETLYKYTGDIKVNGRPALSRNFRPPTLAVSRSGLYTVFDVGFKNAVLGSFSTHDYEADSVDELVNKFKKGITSWDKRVKVTNGTVLVMHMTENAAYTAQALDEMIPEWKEQGFSFARVDDYLK